MAGRWLEAFGQQQQRDSGLSLRQQFCGQKTRMIRRNRHRNLFDAAPVIHHSSLQGQALVVVIPLVTRTRRDGYADATLVTHNQPVERARQPDVTGNDLHQISAQACENRRLAQRNKKQVGREILVSIPPRVESSAKDVKVSFIRSSASNGTRRPCTHCPRAS